LNPRAAAHRILSEVRGGAFADRAAAEILKDVSAVDRGLALEIGYGCIRLQSRLETWIQAYTDRPLSRVDPDMLDWLRIGTYQLKELRTPDHAAVGETMRAARRSMDSGRAGYINAVLRALTAGNKPDPFPSRDHDPIGYLTRYGSHPEWVVRRWVDRWSIYDATRLVTHGNTPPDVVLRMLADQPPARLDGVELRPLEGWPRSWVIVQGSPAAALRQLRAVIQDPAASAVVDYMGADIASPLLDVCAAPGTKAVGLAAVSGAPVFATDVSTSRLRTIREPARRLGLAVVPVAADARRPPFAEAATVLADVPCTGTGVLRRRVDSRWRLSQARLEELVALQLEILDSCAGMVKKGGLLVYSTCSLESEENERQVEAFLERHPDFEREPTEGLSLPEDCLSATGDLFIKPWLTGTDGAYAARLRRAK